MKYNAFTYLLTMLFAVLLASCNSDELEQVEVDIPEGMTKLTFSGLSISTEGSMTRAIQAFAKDSTIRVYMYKVPENGDPTGNDAVITDNPFKEFTLRVEKNNDNTSYGKICNVDDNGKFIDYDEDQEVIVPQGKYRIIAISPAIKLENHTEDGGTQLKPGLEIKHQGIDLLTTGTNGDYDIKAQNTAIGSGKDSNMRVYNVTLPPFQHVMSRITFTIKKKSGDNVKIKNLKIDSRGIEVDGLTPNAYYSNFFIGNDALVDMKQVGGSSAIQITAYTELLPDDPQVYYFQTNILPHRFNEKVPIKFTFHLLVNEEPESGIPARYKAYRYTTQLPKNYERGKSYDYQVQVDVGGIFVNGWKSDEWGTEI